MSRLDRPSIVPPAIAALPWPRIFLLSALACFGATVLFSAAGGKLLPWALPHLIRFGGALALSLAIGALSLRFIRRASWPIYVATLALLVLVELIGGIGGGSQRWLNLGFMTLQPSELMKPAIVLVIAAFFDRLPPARVRSFDAIWPPLGLLAVPFFLVLIQPDLGTSLAVAAGAIVVCFLAGIPMRLFVGAGAVLALVAPLAFFFGLHDYQRRRVTTFLTPEADPLGAGYHISQSKIAIGSGGLTGKGFLNGTQSHLDYLPEGHTDFVFATMAEEWGFVGGVALLIGFGLLLAWGVRVAMASPSRFGQLAAGGLTFTIFFYMLVNLLMVMGLAPVVGIPLPFMSHGGSSMLTIMLCVGVIFAVERDAKRPRGSFD